LPPGASDMAPEYRILSRLSQAYPLTPRALFYCGEPDVLGAPLQVIEYRSGIVIRDILRADAAARAQVGAALSRHMIDCLVALHDLDPALIGLDTLGRPAGFLGRTLESWATGGRTLGRSRKPPRIRRGRYVAAPACSGESPLRLQARQHDSQVDRTSLPLRSSIGTWGPAVIRLGISPFCPAIGSNQVTPYACSACGRCAPHNPASCAAAKSSRYTYSSAGARSTTSSSSVCCQCSALQSFSCSFSIAIGGTPSETRIVRSSVRSDASCSITRSTSLKNALSDGRLLPINQADGAPSRETSNNLDRLARLGSA